MGGPWLHSFSTLCKNFHMNRRWALDTWWALVSFPDPFRKNREGVWQHVLHRRVRAHCTVRANQVAEFSYVTFIKNVRLWRLPTVLVLLIIRLYYLCLDIDKALDIASRRMGYERLFPKQREAVEAFISGRNVFVCLPAGGYTDRASVMVAFPSSSTVWGVKPPRLSLLWRRLWPSWRKKPLIARRKA